MAFELNICLSETCTGIKVTDLTGFFGPENAWGYGAPAQSVPTLSLSGVYGYSEFSIAIFFAKEGGYDPTGTPDFTADLLTTSHTIDPVTGYVTWEFTLEDLGVESLRSGWWAMNTTAIWENVETYDYSTDNKFGFTGDLTSKIDQTMKRYYAQNGGGCPCDCGGSSIQELYMRYRIWRDFIGCVNLEVQFQEEADWLYNHYVLCQC